MLSTNLMNHNFSVPLCIISHLNDLTCEYFELKDQGCSSKLRVFQILLKIGLLVQYIYWKFSSQNDKCWLCCDNFSCDPENYHTNSWGQALFWREKGHNVIFKFGIFPTFLLFYLPLLHWCWIYIYGFTNVLFTSG